MDARVEGTSAALVGPAAQAAAADGNDGGDASPPPPCLTCAMGRGLGDGGLASWVVLVLVVSIGVVCLGIAGTVAYMRIRDRAKNAAKVPKVVAPEGEGRPPLTRPPSRCRRTSDLVVAPHDKDEAPDVRGRG